MVDQNIPCPSRLSGHFLYVNIVRQGEKTKISYLKKLRKPAQHLRKLYQSTRQAMHPISAKLHLTSQVSKVGLQTGIYDNF